MRIFAVIAGVSVRIQRSVIERFDNRLFLNRNSGFSQAVGGFLRQAAGKSDRSPGCRMRLSLFSPALG